MYPAWYHRALQWHLPHFRRAINIVLPPGIPPKLCSGVVDNSRSGPGETREALGVELLPGCSTSSGDRRSSGSESEEEKFFG